MRNSERLIKRAMRHEADGAAPSIMESTATTSSFKDNMELIIKNMSNPLFSASEFLNHDSTKSRVNNDSNKRISNKW